MPHTEEQHASDQQVYGASLICIPVAVQAAGYRRSANNMEGEHSMATTQEEGAVPDFLRMDQPVSSDPANAKKTGHWHGWPTKDITLVTLTDDEGRTSASGPR